MQEYPREESFYKTKETPQKQNEESSSKPQKDSVVTVWKTQVVICLLALLAVGAVRLVGGDIYRNVKDKYIELFCDTTRVEEVTQPSETVTPSSVTTMATVTPTVVSAPGKGGGDTADDSLALKENTLLLTGNTQWQNTMAVPVKGRITSPFGYRVHPIYGTRLFHNGVDIGAESGTPIVAALNGRVEEAEYDDSYGYYVILNHGDDFTTVYAHCSELLVTAGDTVTKGQTIALVGSTGVSTGPHLHFEVRRGEYRVNPEWLVNLS